MDRAGAGSCCGAGQAGFPLQLRSHFGLELMQSVNDAAGFLRGEVGRRLGLRHAPRLEFVFDSSIGEAIRLTSLIDRAVRDDQQKDDPA